MLMAMLLAAQEAPDCAPVRVRAAIEATLSARHTNAAAARATIAPALACPAVDAATFTAHVLGADLAAADADWVTARALLDPLGVHPENATGALAQLLRLRADQGLRDAAGFARDRAETVAADEAQLARLGTKVETFRAGAATVTAFRASFAQGGFRRVLVFSAIPDDETLYPATVMLTDDAGSAAIMKELSLPATGGAHAWFVDLYTCSSHATLVPVGAPGGGEPDYAAVKARVVETLDRPGVLVARPPDRGPCGGGQWMLPGFGTRR